MVLCYSSSRKLILYSKVRTNLLWWINECLLCQRRVFWEAQSWPRADLIPPSDSTLNSNNTYRLQGWRGERTTVWGGIITFEMLLLLFPYPDSTPTHLASTQIIIILYNRPLLHFQVMKKVVTIFNNNKGNMEALFSAWYDGTQEKIYFFSFFSVTISCIHAQVIKLLLFVWFFLISEIVTKPWLMQRRIIYQYKVLSLFYHLLWILKH